MLSPTQTSNSDANQVIFFRLFHLPAQVGQSILYSSYLLDTPFVHHYVYVIDRMSPNTITISPVARTSQFETKRLDAASSHAGSGARLAVLNMDELDGLSSSPSRRSRVARSEASGATAVSAMASLLALLHLRS